MAKVIPEISVDARMIYERLVKASVGDTVTYDELTALIGRNTQNGGRPVIQTARRKAMNEHRMVFAPVRNIGLKRLNDVEIVDTAQADVDKVRRTARRAGRRLTTVDFDQLPNDKKIRHNTFLSMFGALASMTTGGTVKAIEKKVTEARGALPLAKTLEAFGAK